MLVDSDQSTSWIHCIIFHNDYFEKHIEGLSKEQIVDTMCMIARKYYHDEN